MSCILVNKLRDRAPAIIGESTNNKYGSRVGIRQSDGYSLLDT